MDRRSKRDKGELKIAQQLCFALYSTSRAFTKQYASILGDLGLTYPQYLAMMVLWERDGLLVQEIAAKMEIEGATATPLIQRLEKLGLVTRQRSVEDERRVEVYLTDAGKVLFDKALDVPAQIGKATGVSMEQAKRLTAELTHIRSAMGDTEAPRGAEAR